MVMNTEKYSGKQKNVFFLVLMGYGNSEKKKSWVHRYI